MRRMTMAVVAAGSLMLAAPIASAQQSTPNNGLGGAVGALNNLVNPNSARPAQDDNQYRQDDRNRPDDRYRSPSSASPYARMSDQQLRVEASRLDDQRRQMQADERAVQDEMQRRNLRR